MITDDTFLKIGARLAIVYAGRWKPEQTQELLAEYLDVVDDADAVEAIRRHVRNPELVDGQPRGHWPPTPADVEYHLQQIHLERKRAAANEAQEKESDETYKAILAGRATSPGGGFHVGRIQEQIRRADGVRRGIAARFGLSFTDPLHFRFLYAVMEKARDDEELLLPVQAGLLTAESLFGSFFPQTEKGAA